MTTPTTTLHPVPDIVEQAIQACRQGSIPTALDLLAKAIARDARNEHAWLWLSGLVATDSERLFCLNRVLQINPGHVSARHGVKMLPAATEPQPPAQQHSEQSCAFPGCASGRRASSPYCLAHWMAIYRPAISPAAPPPAEPEQPPSYLSASALAEKLGVQTHALLAICAELGWIERADRGWLLTPAGQALGATQQRHPQTNVPFVHWPLATLDNPALPRAIRHIQSAGEAKPNSERALRERAPARLRTTDGHLVRTQAELRIDNWLYNAGLVHAYERPLPTEEEAYCDFYLPTGRIYIEYWGCEREAALLDRKASKQAIYARHKLHLVAIDDQHLAGIDAALPVLLGQFGLRLK
ncbi:hypothetical protein F8S13_26000 [Chloroflexia bacterium SDU3-3]|nr:hypothetical protein F8S13_26000 [Chloroflexia bacterium SDU3-3]